MTPRAKRQVTTGLIDEHRISRRRAVGLMQLQRSVFYYRSRAKDTTALCMRLRELAASRPRYGYRRLHILLQREGWVINHKKVWRLYRAENLTVRTRKKKRRAAQLRLLPLVPTKENQRWSIDFVADQLATGRRFRVFTMLDIFSRQSPGMQVEFSLPSTAVTEALDRAITVKGKPEVITLDNGTEFTSKHFDAWAFQRGIRLDFIAPGRPVENAFIESFNDKLRDECLNLHWFHSLDEARKIIESWRQEYNKMRPHSSLGNLAPDEYVAQLTRAAEGRATVVGPGSALTLGKRETTMLAIAAFPAGCPCRSRILII
jgi:putative transposase